LHTHLSNEAPLDFDLPAIMERGKELSYSLIYNSKIDYPLENLSIKIDSALGFSFKSSDPPSFDNLEWKLKTLSNNQYQMKIYLIKK